MKSQELISYLDDYLETKRFKDYAPNGLQVEGRAKITRVLTAVTASQKAIEAAIEFEADALLVHHGYFWKNENPTITGIKRQRLHSLMQHNINLIAYHLPLDQHPTLGNNALFASHFVCNRVFQSEVEPLIWHAEIVTTEAQSIAKKLEKALGRKPMLIGQPSQTIRRIAWCTGAAQDFFTQAVSEGAQAFFSGEYAERTYHEAHELKALYYSCGHHATERAGIIALGEHLTNRFGIKTRFFDDENPL